MPDSYDGKIDWVRFYDGYLKAPSRQAGANRRAGLSPFRDEKRPSFHFNTETGLWKDEGTGRAGNPTTFLSELLGISTAEANAQLLALAGVERKADERPRGKYGVDAYASEKHLDAATLRSWGVGESKRGAGCVTMEYRDASGAVVATRQRYAPDADKRFSWSKGSTLCLYGLWLMGDYAPDAPVVLVEGESDCHALWSLGICALGVPGASTFKAEWAAALAGRDVLIHSEGDDGARVFVDKVCAGLSSHDARVAVWATPGAFKDPSALYAAAGDADKAREALSEAMRGAESVELTLYAEQAQGRSVLGAYGLVCPQGWHCTSDGVFGETKEGDAYAVTATPVVLARRIIDAAGSGERVELAFMRDGAWRTVVADRDDAFTSRSVVPLLAPLGAHVTSENARLVVRWLQALEAANMGRIATAKSSSGLGWCGAQFLPVDSGDIVLDIDESSADIVSAFRREGSAEAWAEAMRGHRDRSPIFRFVLAAGVAAPLLRAVKGRNFFVYNWASSKGGKTAAIKAALSAWGDTEYLMTTFNATAVGLERMAGLMRDLPLGIDERQAAVGKQEWIDGLIYSLGSGSGRIRGARDGGLQATQHYRTVILATGEEPLSSSTSKTGVATRVLELFGAPFDSEADAAAMHVATTEHFGHAGPAMVAHIKALGDAKVSALHKAMVERLGCYTTHASSHLSGVALVCVADAMLSEVVFGSSAKEADIDAQCMAQAVIAGLEDAAAGDVDAAAAQWLEGWLRSNHAAFDNHAQRVYGDVEGDIYRVFVPVLREALEGAGFSFKKTMRALDERGVVVDKGIERGKESMHSVKRVHGKPSRVVSVDVGVLVGEREGMTSDLPF